MCFIIHSVLVLINCFTLNRARTLVEDSASGCVVLSLFLSLSYSPSLPLSLYLPLSLSLSLSLSLLSIPHSVFMYSPYLSHYLSLSYSFLPSSLFPSLCYSCNYFQNLCFMLLNLSIVLILYF